MAPSLAQGNSQPSTGASAPNPLNCAFTGNVTAGNLMVVAIGGDESGQSPKHSGWTITDTLGSTWHLRGTSQLGAGSGGSSSFYIQVWDAIVPAGGGANTIHWNSSGTNGAAFARICVHEISGANTIDAFQETHGPTGLSAVGAITTTQAVEYVFAWLVHNAGLTSISAPFALLETSSVEMTAGLVTSSTGTYTPTGVAGGNDLWSVLATSYYQVGGGGGPVALTATAAGVGAASCAVTATGGGGGGGPVALILTAAGVGRAQATITHPGPGSGITTIPLPPSGEPPITTTSSL